MPTRSDKTPAVALDAKAKAREKIKHKIKVLKLWRKRGVPEGKNAPTSQQKFLDWADPNPGYGQDPVEPFVIGTLNRMDNADLKKEAEALWTYFREIKHQKRARKESRATQIGRLKEERDELEVQVQNLTNQYVGWRAKAQELETRALQIEQDNQRLKQENSSLRRLLDDLRGDGEA